MRRALFPFIACMFIAGCGSGSGHATIAATTTTTAAANPTVKLEQAARTAIQQNAKASDYVLWNNAIPSWASQSTAGPALAGLRSSAAQRKKAKVRVRVLTSGVKIRSIHLNPSYLSATASIVYEGRVRVYKNARPERRTIKLTEPSNVELHRVDNKTRFVVWKVAVTR
jgi:hypothetical protein